MYANNEIGTIEPVEDIAKLIKRVRKDRMAHSNMTPLWFHTDACQAAGYLDINVERLGVDMLTLNGSKIYGPKGAGVLYRRKGVQIQPLYQGGGQEQKLRSGTENVAAIMGLAYALQIAEEQKSITDFGNEGLVCPHCGGPAKRMGNCAIYCTSCKQTTRSGCGE